MKQLLTFLLFSIPVMTFSQTKIVDSNEVCFPFTVGRQILLDLNELDRLKEEGRLSKLEIIELEKKSLKQETIIKVLEEKDSNNVEIIKMTEEKFEIVSEDNKSLREEIRKVKTKSTIIEIISGAIITSITYIFIFK